MRIFYLSNSVVPSKAANSVHVIKMSQAFASLGHEVTLFHKTSTEFDDDPHQFYGVKENISFQNAKSPSTRLHGLLIYGYRILRLIKKKKPCDLLFARSTYALYFARNMGCPFIYEVHAPPSNFIQKYIETKLLNHPNLQYLVVISEALKKIIMKTYPFFNPDKILVCHDGSDECDFSHLSQLESPLQSTNPHGLDVGYVGHLYPGRGIEIILDLAKENLHMNFHILGGTQQDILHWQSLNSCENVVFYGFIPHGGLERYIYHLDVVLAPYQKKVTVSGSKGDTSQWMSPLKLFEYMAFGKAIICSDIPVLKEVMKDNINCLLVDPENLHAWNQALHRLQDKNLREQLGKEGVNDIHTSYAWKQRARHILAPNAKS